VQSLLSRSIQNTSDPYVRINEPGSNHVVFNPNFVRNCLEVSIQLINDIRIQESYKQALIRSGVLRPNTSSSSSNGVQYSESDMSSKIGLGLGLGLDTTSTGPDVHSHGIPIPIPNSIPDSGSDFKYNLNSTSSINTNANTTVNRTSINTNNNNNNNMEEDSDIEEYGEHWHSNTKDIDVVLYTDELETNTYNSNINSNNNNTASSHVTNNSSSSGGGGVAGGGHYLDSFSLSMNRRPQGMNLITIPKSIALDMNMHLSVDEWLGSSSNEGTGSGSGTGTGDNDAMNVTDDI